ncbi:MAG: serine protein kinase RIO, partial [Candidatus Bathyarchaeota archaeon]|nr:serine protein kinase RIO [Candidatus Bathyarchaeota archaeon]
MAARISKVFAFENINDVKSDSVARELDVSHQEVATLMRSASVSEEAWQNAEVDALYRLAAAGVRVPK